jgi:hypothetical protein
MYEGFIPFFRRYRGSGTTLSLFFDWLEGLRELRAGIITSAR